LLFKIGFNLAALFMCVTLGFFVDSMRRMIVYMKQIPFLRASERMFNALMAVYGLQVLYVLISVGLETLITEPFEYFTGLSDQQLSEFSYYKTIAVNTIITLT